MGSAGNPNSTIPPYDMQKFFKPGNPVSNLAQIQNPPFHPTFNPNSCPSSSHFPFPSVYPNQNQDHLYMNYSLEQNSSPLPYQASPSQLRISSPIPSATTSSEGARLMATINTQSSPSSMELSSSSLPSSSASSSSSLIEPSFSAISAFMPTAPPVNMVSPLQRNPSRLLSTKLPRGRHLHGEHIVYDIDLRFPGEAQPQLEVSPITVYGSDPEPVVGRQIGVNRDYICYGLRAGTIRILNINTALRALLRGHSQRVIDMAFFAHDVHLLVSSSSDGRIFVRKIEEGLGDDDKMQITEKIVLGIRILGNWDSVHPHVCWHSKHQDILFVGVSKYVLRIDIAKTSSAATSDVCLAEEPLKFHIDELIEGVNCIGKHDDDVTDLSICDRSINCLASASKDGTVKIWGDNKMHPLGVLKPHDGQPVCAVGFLEIPYSLDDVVLFTAGPLNQELKLWVSANPDGLFTPSSVKWHCIQTLELKSSFESRNEDAFFNQVFVVARASVILLANAKKNAIYAVHVECGSKPTTTRMDYLAEFSVTMPILSLTATSENVSDAEGAVQIYCVQTQAIQQYALEMSQCFPPLIEFASSEDIVSQSSHGKNIGDIMVSSGIKLPRPINVTEKVSICRSPVYPSSPYAHGQHVVSCVDTAFSISMSATIPTDNAPLSSQVPVPLSPRLSRRLSGMKSPIQNFKHDTSPVSSVADPSDKQMAQEHSIERKSDNAMIPLPETGLKAVGTSKGEYNLNADEKGEGQGSLSGATINSALGDECYVRTGQTRLITPSQLMFTPAEITASDKGSNEHNKFEEPGITMENGNLKVGNKNTGKHSTNFTEDESSEKAVGNVSLHVDYKVSGSSNKTSNEMSSLRNDVTGEDAQVDGDSEILEDRDQSPNVSIEACQENTKDISCKVPVSTPTQTMSPSPSGSKRRKNKNKNNSALLPMSSPSGTPFTSVGSSDGEPSNIMNIQSPENLAAQVVAMQETLNQLISMLKDLPKQMVTAVTSPISKEGKRVEGVIGQRMEKLMKAHVDSLWARIQEENAKREKSERQLTATLYNISASSKELPSTFERLLKKEFSSLGSSMARMVTPNVEKAISTSINDAFQKGVCDKALNSLEKLLGTKLESAVSRNIQAQFQSSGKQVMQDALRTCFEDSVIPAFENSCKAMFEQVDTAFQKGMTEHATVAQQHFSASHSALASTLQDTVASASSLAHSLKSELADGQRKLLTLVESAGASSSCLDPLHTTKNNSSLGLPEKAISLEHLEISLDPTKELSRLVLECKFDEAFNKALQKSDVSIVSWLCSQVDPKSLFSMVPLPLSQPVLFSLIQQLSWDLEKDIGCKLLWIMETCTVLNPSDPSIASHARPLLTQVYQNLHQKLISNSSGPETNKLRLLLHVLNSLLTTCP